MSRTLNLALAAGLLAALGAAPRPAAPADPSLMKLGHTVYAQTCSRCHQPNGRGIPSAFPPLAGNTNLRKLELVVTTIESGHSGRISVRGRRYDETMPPPLGKSVSDLQIAAVATFIRNSWGNAFGAVTEKEVKDVVAKEKPPGQ